MFHQRPIGDHTKLYQLEGRHTELLVDITRASNHSLTDKNGQIVRNWIAGQSFESQYQFGTNVKVRSKKNFTRCVDILGKTVLYTAAGCAAVAFAVLVTICFMGDKHLRLLSLIFMAAFGGFLALSALFTILIFIVPLIGKRLYEPEKLLTFKLELPADQEEALARIREAICMQGFECTQRLWGDAQSFLDIHYCEFMGELDCAAILYTPEMSAAIENAADEAFRDFLSEDAHWDATVRLTAIVCTKSANRTLRTFVRDNNDQSPGAYKFSAAILLGAQEAMIADIKDAFAYRQYKKLRERFLLIIGPLLA